MIRNTGVEEAQYKWFTVREIDAYGIDEDTVLTVAAPGVLGNDTDVDGDALTAALVSGPANGLLTLNTDGSFSFTPNADFNGSDSFSYMAQDPSLAQSNPATVTLTVNAVNDAPVANSDSATTAEDTAVVIPVLANDVDMDEDALTVTNLTQPANGTATLNADNTVT